MHLLESSSSGPALEGPKNSRVKSASLPFGQSPSLSSIGGPTYVTAQALVQQVAYLLSDKLFSYSPGTFDLDVAARDWADAEETNSNGYKTVVNPMQIRNGAGSIALGYMFSKDFDLKKRHIPQGVLASSSALQFLRPALDQLSLLYSISNPFVAHIAAADYDGSKAGGLVSDYVSALSAAEDLGFGLVSSKSAYETQHMSLFATLLAQDLPMLHVYDGVKVGRETTRVIDILDKSGLTNAYHAVLKSTSNDERKHMNVEGKALRTLRALNEELGTDYKPFEYHGHENPEVVLVCFGSVEASLAAQTADALARSGSRVGVINVRLYRPFAEEEFQMLVPQGTRLVMVLGQVANGQALQEQGVRSQLYEDVLAALAFTSFSGVPEIREIKYSRSEVWTPAKMTNTFQSVLGKSASETSVPSLLEQSIQQYTFWNVDDTPTASVASILAEALAKDSSQNVTVNSSHDNLVQGGVHRIDVRKSARSLEASYSVESADTVVVAEVKLLEKIDILKSVKQGGNLVLLLPGVKDDDVEKKIPLLLKNGVASKGINLYLIDSSRTALSTESPDSESLILQTAFLRVALPKSEETGLKKLAAITSNVDTLEKVAADLEKTLRQIEVPKEWADLESEQEIPQLPVDISSNSYESFDKN